MIAAGYPLSHGFQPCQLSHRESQGAAAPPSHLPHISEPGDPQRCWSTAGVTDSNCQRVQPALSVTAFSRASSPYGRAKGRASPARHRGKTVRVRRRSRPWLPLWGSWQAISEPERAYAVAGLQIGALIAAGYPLSHGFQPCQLSHRESQGAGFARPVDKKCPSPQLVRGVRYEVIIRCGLP